jgi:hypothetical protein
MNPPSHLVGVGAGPARAAGQHHASGAGGEVRHQRVEQVVGQRLPMGGTTRSGVRGRGRCQAGRVGSCDPSQFGGPDGVLEAETGGEPFHLADRELTQPGDLVPDGAGQVRSEEDVGQFEQRGVG